VSAEDIITGVLSSPSVFRDKTKLYPEYLPERLPHRERQLKMLAQTFKPLLYTPGEGMQRVILIGSYGTGKTVTSRVFGKSFTSLSRKRGLNVHYVHINCYKARTLPQILHAISHALGLNLPQRGLSVQEMMRGIMDDLDRRNSYVIIALDEFDYFISSNPGGTPVYLLVRAYDDELSRKKRMHFIFIARNLSALDTLDAATSTFFMKNIIRFTPYASRELYDILKERAYLAFHDGVVDDEILHYIAVLEGSDRDGSGSARTALEILVRAGESADNAGRDRITFDDVRKAHVIVKPELAMLQDTIETLGLHELLLLLAIIKTLKIQGEPFVRIGDVERHYRLLCENYSQRPRKHTQVYTYIMGMRNMKIIQTKSSGKGFRGKSTLVGISNAPLDILESRIEEMLVNKSG
jgi:cell division control protein 6